MYKIPEGWPDLGPQDQQEVRRHGGAGLVERGAGQLDGQIQALGRVFPKALSNYSIAVFRRTSSISPQSLMVTVWLGVPSSVPAASISLRAQFEPRAQQHEGTEKRRSAYRSTRKPSMAVPCSHTLFTGNAFTRWNRSESMRSFLQTRHACRRACTPTPGQIGATARRERVRMRLHHLHSFSVM